MKIPFTLDAWLEDKSQKVETRSGKNVRIICWDKLGVPIVALVGDAEDIVTYNRDGTTGQEMRLPSDLFIITPDPELSEFEKAIKDLVLAIDEGELQELGVFEEENLGAWAIKKARELLSLAREQIINDGYVIEKKAFHDAVEKVAPEVMKEVSDKVDMEEAIRLGYEKGKAEALRTHSTELTENLVKSGLDKDSIPYYLIEFMCNLYTCQNWKEIEDTAEAYATRLRAAAMKDLPRWRVSNAMRSTLPTVMYRNNGMILYKDGLEVPISDLEKLPGFKED